MDYDDEIDGVQEDLEELDDINESDGDEWQDDLEYEEVIWFVSDEDNGHTAAGVGINGLY